ncbi:MAG: ubiquinol-cytochrome c reductase iron-sulfur subunit [Vicinamibacterales bacterium]
MSDDARSRREFLHAGGCTLAALVTCALATADLSALPVTTIVGETRGEERKYSIPATDSVSIDHSAQTILVRYQGHVFSMFLGCPHEHAAVKWVEKEHRFQCTKHDSRYQPDGTYTSGRSTRNLDRFAIRREGDGIVIDLDHLFQADRDPAGWAGAVVAL